MKQQSVEAPRTPWWLLGAESCGACQELYLYEAEVRCVECDLPLCPICAMRVYAESVRFCPECYELSQK